jgi:hypothetical protein
MRLTLRKDMHEDIENDAQSLARKVVKTSRMAKLHPAVASDVRNTLAQGTKPHTPVSKPAHERLASHLKVSPGSIQHATNGHKTPQSFAATMRKTHGPKLAGVSDEHLHAAYHAARKLQNSLKGSDMNKGIESIKRTGIKPGSAVAGVQKQIKASWAPEPVKVLNDKNDKGLVKFKKPKLPKGPDGSSLTGLLMAGKKAAAKSIEGDDLAKGDKNSLTFKLPAPARRAFERHSKHHRIMASKHRRAQDKKRNEGLKENGSLIVSQPSAPYGEANEKSPVFDGKSLQLDFAKSVRTSVEKAVLDMRNEQRARCSTHSTGADLSKGIEGSRADLRSIGCKCSDEVSKSAVAQRVADMLLANKRDVALAQELGIEIGHLWVEQLLDETQNDED